MNKVKIHVFDERIMNEPNSSYNRRVYKRLSDPTNGIHLVPSDDGSYLICFSLRIAIVILPGSFLKSLKQSFSRKGGVIIDGVFFHTNSRLQENERAIRWFTVLVNEINKMQEKFDVPEVNLTVIDNAPKNNSQVLDFSSSRAVQRDQSNQHGDISPFEAALKGMDHFNTTSNDDDYDPRPPFDDVPFAGEQVRDDVRESDDDSSDSYFGTLDCLNVRKAEKKWRKHNILVADKDTIRHDSEVIREVLKDIAPGDEPWKVFWRAKMEERIMRCIAITEKELDEVERTVHLGEIFKKTGSTIAFAGSTLGLVNSAVNLIGRSKL